MFTIDKGWLTMRPKFNTKTPMPKVKPPGCIGLEQGNKRLRKALEDIKEQTEPHIYDYYIVAITWHKADKALKGT